MICDFTFKHYKEILKSALRQGFKVTNFRDLDKVKNDKILILRHDVDMSITKALQMAKIEYSLGLKATYFIRVHGEFYFLDNKNIAILKKMLKMGHEIGLHTEASALNKLWRSNLKEIFILEKKYLEELSNQKIISAAEHADLGRPKNFWKKHFFTQVKKEQVGIKNFPQEKKYQKFHYLSDSLQSWREGCLCDNLAKYNKIQVCVHADWWE